VLCCAVQIGDEVQRAAIESQIAHFGQTPTQLFKKPHPRRTPSSGRGPFSAAPRCAVHCALHLAWRMSAICAVCLASPRLASPRRAAPRLAAPRLAVPCRAVPCCAFTRSPLPAWTRPPLLPLQHSIDHDHELTMHSDACRVRIASACAALALRDERDERRRLSSQAVPAGLATSEIHSLRLPKQPYTLVAGYGDGVCGIFPAVHAPRLCLQRCMCERWTRNGRRST
jgi:hypothetical protein